MSVETQDLPGFLDVVCEGISLGMSVQKACEEAKINPDTFYRYLRLSDKVAENYTRARENRAHIRFERLQDLLDDVKDGKVEPHAARVIMDGIKWQAGKEKAKVYGDSTILRGDRENPLDIGLAGLLDAAAGRRAILPAIEGEATHVQDLPAISQDITIPKE